MTLIRSFVVAVACLLGLQAPAPNVHGKVPVLEYHLVGDHESMYSITREHFQHDLDVLYAHGYRPISVSQLVDKQIDVPPGMSPVVFTFDDASPEQFRYIQKPDGSLEIDSTSAIGIWLKFHAKHPDWPNHATFCLLSGANAGHNFFGYNGIQGQKTSWRFKKVQFLAQQGFELCDHTLWHAQLNKYSDAFVQEQIARNQLAIDSAVPGYHVRTFALPQGLWPKNKELAHEGQWKDVHYKFDAILEVAGPPAPSPYDPAFNPLRMPRIQAFGNAVDRMVADLDRTATRFVAR
ncbi:MAG TPA: polysaccharide deacetylase family protein [Gemmatimonadaceae bacterium]|nr:polysaccharide deacetylase family protein [Gemmatimonadaceae bacterium]